MHIFVYEKTSRLEIPNPARSFDAATSILHYESSPGMPFPCFGTRLSGLFGSYSKDQWGTLYKTRVRSNSGKKAWFEDRTLCPCCFYPTLSNSGIGETCRICGWIDAEQMDTDTNEVKGGPNGDYSLREARSNFRKSLDMFRSSDIERKKAMLPSLEARKRDIESFNQLLTGAKPEKICCERFQDFYETGEIVFAYADTQEIDETQWFIDGLAHLYYCPFCGEYIKGRGFGVYR